MTEGEQNQLSRLYQETLLTRNIYLQNPNIENWDRILSADCAYYIYYKHKLYEDNPSYTPPPKGILGEVGANTERKRIEIPEPEDPEPDDPIWKELADMENERGGTDCVESAESLLFSNRKFGFDRLMALSDKLDQHTVKVLGDAQAITNKALVDAQVTTQRVANDAASASQQIAANMIAENHMATLKGMDNTLTSANELGTLAGVSIGRQNVNADATQSSLASLVAAIVPIVVANLRDKAPSK